MATTYELRPCMDDFGEVVPCEPSEAEYFGVYAHEGGEPTWVADFAVAKDAEAYIMMLEEQG